MRYASRNVEPMTRYRRLAAAVLLTLAAASSCGSEGELPLEAPPTVFTRNGLEYRAEFVNVLPHFIIVQVLIHNTTDRFRVLHFPDRCVVLMRAYRTVDEALVFDQFNKTCREDQPVEPVIPPRETRAFETNALVHFMLGPTLPEGFYIISAYLRPVGESEIELIIGGARLSRLPLP